MLHILIADIQHDVFRMSFIIKIRIVIACLGGLVDQTTRAAVHIAHVAVRLRRSRVQIMDSPACCLTWANQCIFRD